ncbi:hypothetical protein PHBOTO_005092 [Pseudozyma hubeiensis]|nr:hypothetical protein PHBOTO_005092 [Pseudozyma hubeiensis]
MFHSAPSPGRNGPSSSSSYGFATPVRTPSTSYHAYSQALTPTDASAKAVRFQNQPLPPQTQQQTQNSALTSVATPNKSSYQTALSTSTQPQPQQQQLTQRNAMTSAGAAPAGGSENGSKMTVTRSVAAASGTESTIALKRRIKWNLSALGLLWIVPAVSTRPRDAYWLVLDQIYMHVGGDTDELVDGVVGWIMWAVSVVLLFNAVEAAVLVQRASSTTSPAPTQSNTTTTNAALPAHAKQPQTPVLGMHSPSIAKSINFVAASRLKGSPKTRTSDIGAGSPISRSSPKASPKQDSPNSTVDYSQFSPANRRASSPISTPNSFGSASRAGTPTTMTEYGGGVVGSGNVSGSSPLAAFRARHVSRGSSSPARARSITPSVSGSGLSELSFDASDGLGGGAGGQEEEETFLGDESFEVDRALKSLRGSLGGVSSTPAPGFR